MKDKFIIFLVSLVCVVLVGIKFMFFNPVKESYQRCCSFLEQAESYDAIGDKDTFEFAERVIETSEGKEVMIFEKGHKGKMRFYFRVRPDMSYEYVDYNKTSFALHGQCEQ